MSQYSDLLQTPLATAICMLDDQEVQRILGEEKAASTVFVKGSERNSILCTLPNAPKPISTVISHRPPLQNLPGNIMDIVDHSIGTFLNSLPTNEPVFLHESDSANSGFAFESFRVGDIVRIAPGVVISSISDSANMGMVAASEGCLGDNNWGRLGVISSSISKTDHPSGENGFLVKECVFGGQFTYLESDLTYGDTSTPDTEFRTCGVNLATAVKVKQSPPVVLVPHEYVISVCMICTSCNFCTGYGKGCCMCGSTDRSSDRGRICGCGHGKSGCKQCGMCDLCGGTGATCTGSQVMPLEPGVILLQSGWISTSSNQQYVHNMISPDPLTMWRGPKASSLSILIPPGIKSDLCAVELLLHSSCSEDCKVTVSVGLSLSTLVVVATPTLKAKNSTWQSLVQSHHYSKHSITCTPSIFKLDFQSSVCIAGIRLREVAIACQVPKVPLMVGDRVCLSETCTDPQSLQWCLGKNNSGTVVCAPAPGRRGKDQRGVIVMHEDTATAQIRYAAYKSSWLKRSEESHVFAVGDRVRLRPGIHSENRITVDNKCLGTLSQRRYGIVCSVGALRNGVQRNVEVLCPLLIGPQHLFTSSNDWQEMCEGDKDCARSLYPAAVLTLAERSMVVLEGDIDQLKSLIKEHLDREGAKVSIDTNALVDKFGLEVWSMLVRVVGVERVLDIFRDWLNRYASHWPKDSSSDLLEPRLGSLCVDTVFASTPARDGEEHKEGRDIGLPEPVVTTPVRTTWSCASCLYAGNGQSSTKCAGCGEKGRPWECAKCRKTNKVNVFECTGCGKSGLEAIHGEAFPIAAAGAAGAKQVVPIKLSTSLKGPDPSVLFSGDASSAFLWSNDSYTWVEWSIPGDLVLDALDIYLDSSNRPKSARVIGVTSDLYSGSTYCRGKGCNFAPSSHPNAHGYCCQTCQRGIHSLNCSSSCRKGCTVHHKNDICRRCDLPAFQHEGPTHHVCLNGSRGVFSYFPHVRSRVQEEVKFNPGMQKDINLEGEFGWTSILTREDCMDLDIKSVWISFAKMKGSDEMIRVPGIRMTGRETTIPNNTFSEWRCARCFASCRRRAVQKSHCSFCRARLPTTLNTLFAGSQFLSTLSLRQKKALRAQVAYIALLQNMTEIVQTGELENDDVIELRKWRIEGMPLKGSKMSVEFVTESGQVHFELCVEGKIFVMYVRNGPSGARTRLTYRESSAKWILTETNDGLVLINEDAGGKVLKIPSAPVKSFNTSNIKVTEMGPTIPIGFDALAAPPVDVLAIQNIDLDKGENEFDSDSDSEDDDIDDDIDAGMEIALNEIFASITDMGDLSPPESISSASESHRMRSVFFWSTSSLEGFETLKQLIEAKDRDNCTCAHLAAYCGLQRTVETLFANGAAKWSANRKGHTPMGLLCGLRGEARIFTLHKLCCLGNFFDGFISITKSISPAIECLLRCPENFDIEEPFVGILASIQSGDSEQALEMLADFTDETTHFRVYKALASLYAGYGSKGCAIHLSSYVDGITALAKASARTDSIIVNPLYFYVRYMIWKLQSSPESSSKVAKKSAAYALQILREFPCVADRVLDDDDNVDKQMGTELIPQGEDDDDDDSVDLQAIELPPNAPENEWIIARVRMGVHSTSMDKLMGLVGLKDVKVKAMAVVKEVLLAPLRPVDINTGTSMNFLYTGNPGCGKTTVATLLAGAMVDVGYRSNPDPVLTNAGEILKNKDPVEFFDQLVARAKGGTIFIDEAYQFNPAPRGSTPNASNQVLDYLIKVTEEMRETTTFILVGYKDQIMELLAYNEKFRSRFPADFTFQFEDYDEYQLRKIFCDMVRDRGFKLESKRSCGVNVAKIISRRMARGANKKGFGNARHVRNVLNTIVSTHTARIGSKVLRREAVSEAEHRTLMKIDVIGDEPNLEASPLLRELDSMVGLEKVKVAVHGLMELQKQNYQREMRGEYPEVISLHRVFFGNPGTGKTTVARIYGALLQEFGFLSNGDLVTVTASDLIGDAVGAASTKTAAILDSARGKVLFIDEAYVLDPNRRGGNMFGGSVLDTIVEKIEGAAGSDMAVIMAGYEHQMHAMFRNSGNAGLNRRFNLSEALRFEDFSDSELLTILKRNVARCGLIIDPATARAVTKKIAQGRRMDGFGNAGAVESAVNSAKAHKSLRLSKAQEMYRSCILKGESPTSPLPHPDILVLSDFIVEETSVEKAKEAFASLSCADFLLDAIDTIAAGAQGAKDDGRHPSSILADSHMVFYGPPGTGKTEAAKRFGKALFNLELIPRDSVVCVTGQNLQGAHIGATPPLVYETMQKAKGGILFIDEAYALIPKKGNYGEEAILALLDYMTKDEFKGNLLVILAGYEDDIEKIFTVNPGLRSRFDKMRVKFTAWSAQDALDCTLRSVTDDNKTMTDAAHKLILKMYELLVSFPDWSSAREVKETVLPSLYMARAIRLRDAARVNPETTASGPVVKGRVIPSAIAIPPYEVSDVIAVFEKNIQHRCNGNTRDLFRKMFQSVV